MISTISASFFGFSNDFAVFLVDFVVAVVTFVTFVVTLAEGWGFRIIIRPTLALRFLSGGLELDFSSTLSESMFSSALILSCC